MLNRPFLFEGYDLVVGTGVCELNNGFMRLFEYMMSLVLFSFNFVIFRKIHEKFSDLEETLQKMVYLLFFPVGISLIWGIYMVLGIIQLSGIMDYSCLNRLAMLMRVSQGVFNRIIFNKLM